MDKAQVTTVRALLSMDHTTALCGVVTVIAGMLWVLQRQNRLLPPGPPVYLPGLGHLLKLANNPLTEFRSLREKYGDVFGIYMGTRLAVVLNGYDVINEVLQTRGPEFSYRPPTFLAKKLAQYKGLLNTSGKVWHEQKNNIVKSLRTLTSKGGDYDLHLETEVERLCEKLQHLVKDKQSRNVDVTPHIRKTVCSSAFFLVFGRFLEYDSRELTLYSDTLEELFGYIGNLAVVNFIPYVHLLPGDPVSYHRCIEVAKVIENELIQPEIKRLVQPHVMGGVDSNGNNLKCLTSFGEGDVQVTSLVAGYIEEMMRKQDKGIQTQLNEEHLIKTAGDLMAGGYDTVSNTLQWLIIYLIHHQEVQNKCRTEGVRALSDCGGRFAHIARSQLVYTQATIMEVQRLANVGPLPPVHCPNQDTTIRGFHIPKDTLIMTNMDSLMNGPHVGCDSHEFRPERFIGVEGKLVQPKWFMPYSIGSRMCLGATVAKKLLLVVTVGLLTSFRFTCPVVDGQPQTPSLKGNLGLTHIPQAFTVSLESISH